MSGVHFEISNTGGGAELRDRGSTNGTWLDADRIHTWQLREGDRFRAGKTVFIVEFIEPRPGSGTASEQDKLPPVPAEPVFAVPVFDSSQPENPQSPGVHKSPEMPAPAIHWPPSPSAPRGSSPIEGSLSLDPGALPFDQQDLSEKSKPLANPGWGGQMPFSPLPAGSPGRRYNPLTESSVINNPSPVFAPKAPVDCSVSNFQILRRQTYQDAADSFAMVVDALAMNCSITLLLHPLKIRVESPPDILNPLFDWLPLDQAARFSPTVCSWQQFCASAEMRPLLPRLCKSDGCLALLGSSLDTLNQAASDMMRAGVEGFSEPDGHLPCYWPSSIMAMIDAQGTEICSRLFGATISGVLFCSPWSRRTMIAVANPSTTTLLLSKEFEVTSRILEK